MPLTDFLLTFAVEHVQHGFSDFARSYCTMDTPRRQLLLQMFFFFLGGCVYKWKENKSSIQMTLHWDAYIQVNPWLLPGVFFRR